MGNCNDHDLPNMQDSLSVAAVYLKAGDALMKQKVYRNASIYFQKAHDIQIAQLSCMDMRLVDTYSNLALSQKFQGNHNEALRILIKALKVCEHNKNQAKALQMYLYVGEVYADGDQGQEALKTFEHALSEAKAAGNERCAIIGSIAFQVALIHKKQDDYVKAIEYLDQALNLFIENYGEDHASVADCYNLMGLIHKKQHNFKAALRFYKKGICVRERNLSDDHLDLATSYNNLALVLKENQKFTEALDYLEKCLKIELEHFGSNHTRIETTMKSVACVTKMLPSDAEKIEERFTRILNGHDMKVMNQSMSMSPASPTKSTWADSCKGNVKASISTIASFRMSCL